MAGVNQTIMLALSMVVIAAMIGAGGLGGEVWRAIQRLQPGAGFEAGIAVVIVAMLFDRISKRIVA
jgi:glycine betaine/proline transport system permease protein